MSRMRRIARFMRWVSPALALAALVLVPRMVHAQGGPSDAQAVADAVTDTTVSLNVFWTLLAGFLVFFMQAGFALVETGFTRAKNVAHTMMMNMMVFCIGALGYWLTGFAFQFGGVNYTYPDVHGLGSWAFSPTSLGDWTGMLDKPLLIGGQGVLGLTGFGLAGVGLHFGVLTFFLFQMVFMDTAATIPTGAMAERLKFVGFVLRGLWVSMFI
jgi:Amt family ammonium transporter